MCIIAKLSQGERVGCSHVDEINFEKYSYKKLAVFTGIVQSGRSKPIPFWNIFRCLGKLQLTDTTGCF